MLTSTRREKERRIPAELAIDLDRGFEHLYLLCSADIYSLLRRLGAFPLDAEELAAETFARAYTALRGYGPARRRTLKVRAWLVTIALNCWRNDLRSRARRVATGASDDIGETVDPRARTEDAALDGFASDLRTRLNELVPREREAVVLRHVLDLPIGEVAAALGVPIGTAKSHVSRGLAHLRASLSASEHHESIASAYREER